MGKLLGPAPRTREIEVACLAALGIELVLWLAAWSGHGNFLERRVGQDFAGFYNAGKILNDGLSDRLYDLNLHRALYQQLGNTQGDTDFPYAPWFALIFRPFAALPFRYAYLAWVAVSVLLYLAGVRLLWPAGGGRGIALAALSFPPFVVETLQMGQVSAVAFFFLAAGIRLLRARKLFLAGCVISVCVYKPTLLALTVMMLIVHRRWKTLAGMAAGATAFLAASLLFVGRSSLGPYIRTLRFYSELSASYRDAFLAWEKFIDGYHFLRSLPGGSSVAMTFMGGIAALFFLYALGLVWLKSARAAPEIQELAWAATLTFTLVLNFHVQDYDAILLVTSLLLSAGVIRRRQDAILNAAYFRITVLLWVLAWVSQALTQAGRVQVFSLAILLLGMLQIATVERLSRSAAPHSG